MRKAVNPKETTRAAAFELWMKAPNPMVTFSKTYDVMPLIKAGKNRGMKFNMLLDFCIGRAAASVMEFYLLPVRTILISSMPIICDIRQKYAAPAWTATCPKNTWLSVHPPL